MRKSTCQLSLISLFVLLALNGALGQGNLRVDPPHWWVGHPIDTLELLVHISPTDAQGFDPEHKGEVYLDPQEGRLVEASYFGTHFLHIKVHLNLSGKARTVPIRVSGRTLEFPLLERSVYRRVPFDQSDLMYLITPDRFRNADLSNDDVYGMRERGTQLDEPYARHGGDLKGIQESLDHIASLGASAIWLNPVLENDMERDSYHGYAITDHYAVDPRFGGNEALQELATALHQRGMKHVADVVYNHWGIHHYLQSALPDSAMIHFNEDGSIPYSSYRFSALSDPYAHAADVHAFENGWFAGVMPDLNQDHPITAAYIQYATLWYVEEFQVDGLRCDTYAFSSADFLIEMNRLLRKAYPELFIFGETWAYSEASQLYFAPNDNVSSGWTGNDAVTDFTLWRAIHQLYSATGDEQTGWATGAGALYYRLAADYLYERPEDLVIFLDNHDDGRFLGQMNNDQAKLRSALTVLYHLRGIPVLLYGTEMGLNGHDDHGAIREDMPGFSSKSPDYTKMGEDLLNLCQELGELRKLRTQGEFHQQVPQNGWVVLSWENSREKTVLVLNATEQGRDHEYWKGVGAQFESANGGEIFHPWEAKVYHLNE